MKTVEDASALLERADHEVRILILAPTGRDGPLTRQFLADAGLLAENCDNAEVLRAKLQEGCGFLLLAEEALRAVASSGAVDVLTQQPPWSDIPITIVMSNSHPQAHRTRQLKLFGPGANVTLLERPFRPATLISTIEAGLRARRRQYQVRDLLAELACARDTAERASRAKDDFLATLSHELRTPLNPVLLLASEAATDDGLAPEVRSDFDMIATNVALEARLIDDLLDLTRISRGKLMLDLRLTDVSAVLRDGLAAVEAELKNKNLTLRLFLAADRHDVMADPVRLQQVIWNILKNAVKFTPDGGLITITTRSAAAGGSLAIDIADTGIGMTPAEIAAAFDAFMQGDHASRSSTQRFGGLGLGLAISRMLVELHQGTISATSEGRGMGSTFTVTLPLARANAAHGPGRASLAQASCGQADAPAPNSEPAKRVLVVEDHEPTRSSLVRLLTRRGFEVTATDTAAGAREAASVGNYDLLISDLGLPDGNGCDLVGTIGENFPCRIALSGYGMESDLERTRQAGFHAHLVKPLSVQSLERALRDVLANVAWAGRASGSGQFEQE